MNLSREWFFSRVRIYTDSMKKQLSEDMEALRVSLVEHEAGLKVLKKAKVGPHIQEQFGNIIERHTKELKEREENYETASAVYDAMLKLNEGTTLDDYIKLLSMILQIPGPVENDTMNINNKTYLYYEDRWIEREEAKE